MADTFSSCYFAETTTRTYEDDCI